MLRSLVGSEMCIRDRSAKITGPNEITIVFSEDVYAPSSAFGDFVVLAGSLANGDDNSDTSREITQSNRVQDRMTYRVIFDGEGLGTDASGNIELNPANDNGPLTGNAAIRDVSGELLATVTQAVDDGQAPQIKSVKIIDNNDDDLPRVQIEYTEAVIATTSNYSLNGLRNVNAIHDANDATVTDTLATEVDSSSGLADPTGDGTNIHRLILSAPKLPVEATGSVDFIASFIGNNPRVQNAPVDAVGNPLVATPDHPLNDHLAIAAQIPTIESAKFTGPNEITIVFSETLGENQVNYDSFTNKPNTCLLYTSPSPRDS